MKKIHIWLLAILITFLAAYYQRKTGPTYPKSEILTINSQQYKIKFITSHGGETDAEVIFDLPEEIEGTLSYHKYPTNEPLTDIVMKRTEDGLIGSLPHQPPAGKLEYFVKLSEGNKIIYDNSIDPVVIRFKGDVPAHFLIPHILFMFLAMLFSTFTGILAFRKDSSFKKYGIYTLILLILGGGILGPIIQKFAFGDLWTGIPFGWDLTDNKTLIGLLGWIIAVVLNIKKERPIVTIIASILLLIIYSIPHSLFGSQLNHETGEVIQGFVMNFLFLF
ncbi:MAG: hypothetical protein JXL97_15280 [Bacteroidales bacterium]|nr:hypothetical protein [Bacteroidales bacterium]